VIVTSARTPSVRPPSAGGAWSAEIARRVEELLRTLSGIRAAEGREPGVIVEGGTQPTGVGII